MNNHTNYWDYKAVDSHKAALLVHNLKVETKFGELFVYEGGYPKVQEIQRPSQELSRRNVTCITRLKARDSPLHNHNSPIKLLTPQNNRHLLSP